MSLDRRASCWAEVVFFNGLWCSLVKTPFPIVADLLPEQSRIIEAVYRLLRDEGSPLPCLFDTASDRIGNAAFIVFDFDVEEASLGIDELDV